jgi:hypothetical protein
MKKGNQIYPAIGGIGFVRGGGRHSTTCGNLSRRSWERPTDCGSNLTPDRQSVEAMLRLISGKHELQSSCIIIRIDWRMGKMVKKNGYNEAAREKHDSAAE